ncbi:MAG: Pycsar system effector family protein [bacterium]
MLEHIAESTQHLDHQINIVIGISAATFVLTSSMFEKESDNLALFLIMVFAGASALVGLLAVHPPRYMRKRGQPESLLYRKKIESFDSPKEYEKAAAEAMESPEKTREQYSIEVYNLCKYYYRPKRKLFHISRKLLFIGIFLSLFIFIIHFIIEKIG